MRNMLILSAAIMGSRADAVFYDSFDGTEIDWDNWGYYSERVAWVRNSVQNSLLHVFGMQYPNGPDNAWLVGGGEIWGDGVDMRARVGWEDKQGQMMMNVMGSTPYNGFAWITFSPGTLTAWIKGDNGKDIKSATISIPRQGWETLRINRKGQFVSIFFGEQMVVAAETDKVMGYNRIALGWFAQSEQTPMSYYADWAYVIPEPSSLAALGFGVLLTRRRRRKR